MRYTTYKDWEQYKKHFVENFPMEGSYVICGVGEGYHSLRELFPAVKIRYCLDAKANSLFIEGMKLYPYSVLTEQDVQTQKFIITAGCEYYSEIRNCFHEYGVPMHNICSLPEVLFFWGVHYQGKLYSLACNVILLTHCNLRCKACSQLVPYVRKYRYSDAVTIKDDLDRYFRIFDYVKELVLIGGETMLYNELAEICLYIRLHFSDRYHELKIFTNGTIMPEEKVIQELSKLDRVHVWISDYTCSIDRNKNELIEYLEKYRICYTLNNAFGQSAENRWFDLGDPRELKNGNVVEHFCRCSLVCQSLWDHKIYYCAPSCAAVLGNISAQNRPEVSLDLVTLEQIPLLDRVDQIGKFSLGFIEKGYLESCAFCNGFGMDVNRKFIQAGEQC